MIDLMPSTVHRSTTTAPIMLPRQLLTWSPRRPRSFMATNSTTATIGNTSPFTICATKISATGRVPSSAVTAPIKIQASQTVLASGDRISRPRPSVSNTMYAAARGAVTAEDTPAAPYPSAKHGLPKNPTTVRVELPYLRPTALHCRSKQRRQ